MKSFVIIISSFIFLGTTNVDSPKNKYQTISAELKKNWNTDFNGLWVNESNERRAINRCNISFEGNQYVVQMWGSCTPQDCDWGKNMTDGAEKGANKFELVWDSGFAESLVTYEIVEDKLKLTNKRRFKDGSGRQDYTLVEYFVKQ